MKTNIIVSSFLLNFEARRRFFLVVEHVGVLLACAHMCKIDFAGCTQDNGANLHVQEWEREQVSHVVIRGEEPVWCRGVHFSKVRKVKTVVRVAYLLMSDFLISSKLLWLQTGALQR